MRKYDVKNKRNIGIIIVISVIIIIMFSLVIRMFLTSEKKEFDVLASTLVFDKDKTIVKVVDSAVIKTKWNNDYYLICNDENYELGDTAIAYKEDTGEIFLYGKYYEIGSGDEINVTSDETVIKNSALTKFYKLADRKYLVIDREIKSSDGLLSTTDFLMIDLDKVGNATLTNHKVSLKTFSETVIVTSNYTFDIANEILTYGSDKIDLKKIIGSTNTYTKEDLVPEENAGTVGGGSGITDVTENPNGNIGTGESTTGTGAGGTGGSGNGANDNGSSGEGTNNTIIEEIKKASKKTSIVSTTSTASKINVDYVIYDPYKEYTSVYMEVRRSGSNNVETVYLNSNSTNYVISNNIFPNTKYGIVFKCTYIDSETGEEVRETIDEVSITTKLPSVSIKVTNTSFGKVTYQITTDNSYEITSGNLIVLVNDEEKVNEEISINGNTIGNVIVPGVLENDVVEFRLNDIKSGDVIINGLKSSYMFKY